ncbi:MAG: OmpH family outer membrane protein [Gammaproteobacteria bacterium]|nr:OmpH family outer membrane protein [Gammaproteobacteria bacterium]
MNKLIPLNVLIALILSLSANTVFAQNVKIGAVNAVRILENSPQAEAAREKIQREFAPRDRQLIEEQKKLKALEDKLSKDGAIMSEAERSRLEREIIQLKRDMKRSQDEFRDDLNFRRNEEFGEIQKSVLEAIQQVAKDEGYDIVLGEGVVYASEQVDISEQVIEYLKKKHGSGGGQ